ncbi:MAG: hypothetical protein PW786_07675 [Arachidicoccus sp.]|nr:hypothetical protein [Arachidicoccus sp.]
MLKTRLIFLFILFLGTNFSYAKNVVQSFDKTAFYEAMKSESIEMISDEIAKVQAASIKEKEAYQGALLMKKAGLLKKPKDKLQVFKQGGKKLEAAIANDNDNVEYHFLRLTIQEHAPKILKYNKQIGNDAQFVKAHFKTLPPEAQQAVIDYAKTSKALHPQDFN